MDDRNMVDDDPNQFQEGRDGDHMMIQFQCDTCHFVNVQKRLPFCESYVDDLLLMCIRRVILDSMWSRERSTVRGNLSLVRSSIKEGELLGLGAEVSFPPLGPFPTEDQSGIALACIMMMRSLKPGRNASRIQFETLRKTRSCHSNYSHASYYGTGDTFMHDDGNGARVSHAVSNSVWFKRFLQGCHRRMGDVWLPDKAVSRYVIGGCFNVLTRWWDDIIERDKTDTFALRRVATAACIIISGYYGGLRGEEINKVDVGATRKHWKGAIAHPKHPHVPLILSGKFKKQTSLKVFYQPLALMTAAVRPLQMWFG